MARSKAPRGARAVRRAAEREKRAAPPAAATAGGRAPWRLGLAALWGLTTLALFAAGLAAIRHKVGWYLAVDQLGYLLFARDLLAGHVFHHWPPAEALATRLPDPTDVLAQSYIWEHGRLYSRYAPGFPLLLALWTGLFGEQAAHGLNPLVFVALLCVLVGLVWQAHRSLWRGTTVAALALLCPTGLTLWALTPTRDLSAHLCALAGLAVLAGRGPLRALPTFGAAAALGYAVSIRPDAVLYWPPALILAGARLRRGMLPPSPSRLAGAVAAGVLLGLMPSFVFYGIETGNPFRPPQAVEVQGFFGPARLDALELPSGGPQVGYPPGAWRGGDAEPVSGEGMKLAYLPTTLPGNWTKIRKLYGDVLVLLAVAGLGVTAAVRPALALALGTYIATALLFYSCWGRPYGRYLVSIWLLAPVLMGNGMLGGLDLVRRAWRRGARDQARWAAVGAAVLLVGVYLTLGPQPGDTLRLELTRLLVAGTALGLGAAAAWPARRVGHVVAPIFTLALVLFGTAKLAEPSPRAGVQRPEIERATATARQVFPPRSVLITTEDIGRPAENFEYYAGVPALYLTDLARWQLSVEEATFLFLVAEMEPYLLIPRTLPEREGILHGLRTQYALELVTDIPPERNVDYFVASAFHSGIPLELWRVR